MHGYCLLFALHLGCFVLVYLVWFTFGGLLLFVFMLCLWFPVWGAWRLCWILVLVWYVVLIFCVVYYLGDVC